MSDHIEQQVLQEFFAKKGLILLEKGKTGFFWFTRVGETSTHIENILLIWSRGSVAHCFNLLCNVRYRTTERTAPNRRQRFESSCNQSVFNFFSLLGPNVLALFFHLLIFFILRGLLYLI